MFERYDYLARQIEALLDQQLGLLKTNEALLRAMRHSLLARAKRLRAVLLLLTLEAYGFPWQSGCFPALALEYIHCYSLIHDDLPCMDDDYLRRGRPTNHLLYGDAMAVLAGDALLTEAFGLLGKGCTEGHYASTVLLELLDELAHAAGAMGMVAGQAEDLLAEDLLQMRREGTIPCLQQDLKHLRRIHLLKTGALLKAPFLLAASIAGVTGEERERLGIFGAQFGLVFQIQDDLLDCSGDPEAMGKATSRDVRRQKLTYPALLGLSEAKQILNVETEILRNMLADLSGRHEAFQLLIDALHQRQS